MTVHDNVTEQSMILADDPRWSAADRVAASQYFKRSGRLNAFLLHIVKCTIEQRTGELTETQIGVQVFGRTPGYNPSEDNIVRSSARQLRQRLALYYQSEGSTERTRIQVPRGGYVPNFVTDVGAVSEPAPQLAVSIPAAATYAQAPDVESAVVPEPVNSRLGSAWAIVAALLTGVILAASFDRSGLMARHHSSSATDPLWVELFSSGQTTLFVPGDAGLNTYNIFSGRPQQLSLREYLNRDHEPLQMENLASKQVYPAFMWPYTPLGDLKLANLITRVGPFRSEHYEIRGSQDMTSDSFRDTSVILAGAPPYNPWVELFDDKLNFHLLFDGANRSMRVINRHPQAGEPSTYVFQENPDYKLGYGYIALTDNLQDNGRVLLIEGTSMAGVDAAVSFLFDEKKMAPIIDRAKGRQGKLSNFEVVLQAPFLKGTAGNVSLVASRYYPNN